MKIITTLLLCFLVFPCFADSHKQGANLGANTSEKPHWFKESFLEFEQDIAEAAEQNKRLMLYFHQQGCPYCARLVQENFADPEIEAFIRKHFDGIEINMWGDREIVSIGGKIFTEKTFAAALKVQYTPTLLFLDEQGRVALRLNGYYPSSQFRQALYYVAQKQESRQSFNEYLLAKSSIDAGSLINEDFYLSDTDLQSIINKGDKPLAVYFEVADCAECETLHQRVLTDEPTRKLVTEMNNVQLNVLSDAELITPEGQRMSQRAYAKQLNISYFPSVVLFDRQGQEVHRMEGFLKTFHFQSSLAYVLEQAYLEQPSFQRYISARGEKLRELGFDTDIWGYRSAYPSNVQNEN